MALFYECMLWCAPILLDTADIVRDGDFATATPCSDEQVRDNIKLWCDVAQSWC